MNKSSFKEIPPAKMQIGSGVEMLKNKTGKILTLIDATTPESSQSIALKSLVKNELNELYAYVI